ncbi:MAG: hypothetical protein IJY04_02770, partial [Clostridia bacterium]|nr:hypothetical protein [Clostridia bacterium]
VCLPLGEGGPLAVDVACTNTARQSLCVCHPERRLKQSGNRSRSPQGDRRAVGSRSPQIKDTVVFKA